jgi:phosphate transport system permease protein
VTSHETAGQRTGPGQRSRTGPRALPAALRNSGTRLLQACGGTAAVIPLLALAFVVVTLALEAIPAIRFNGWGFFARTDWRPGNFYGNGVITDGIAHPPGASYGALPLIVGTLASSAIALIIGVPVAVGAALAVVERLPRRVATWVGFVLELLAGIPSVVIGLWGALTFGPFIAKDVAPLVADHLPDVPVLRFFAGPTGNGEGLLTSGLILAIMIIPIVAATTRDLLAQVPILPREGAQALGMSDWEVTRQVTIPWIRSGIIGAVVLGLGRALGETMAVAMVSGAVLGTLPGNVYATMSTIAATIVSQLDSALTDATGFAVQTLAETGLVLAVITLAVNVGARWLVRRVAGTALPVGRGV